jgi:CheY-like chemotaxis protein
MSNALATLLIVDDEPSILESLSYVLTEIGYSVRSAGDGFSALREMRHDVPDLLLSDLNMPKMSGFELLWVVRRRFPEIRTIAMSGSFSGNEVPSGVAADGFYPKGGSIAALLRVMTSPSHIERHAPQPSYSEPPLWIDHNAHDASPEGQVTITCPECLRSFPQSPGAGYLPSETDCIYCESPIRFAIAQPAGLIPLQNFQRKTATAMFSSSSAPNLNY